MNWSDSPSHPSRRLTLKACLRLTALACAALLGVNAHAGFGMTCSSPDNSEKAWVYMNVSSSDPAQLGAVSIQASGVVEGQPWMVNKVADWYEPQREKLVLIGTIVMEESGPSLPYRLTAHRKSGELDVNGNRFAVQCAWDSLG